MYAVIVHRLLAKIELMANVVRRATQAVPRIIYPFPSQKNRLLYFFVFMKYFIKENRNSVCFEKNVQVQRFEIQVLVSSSHLKEVLDIARHAFVQLSTEERRVKRKNS